MLAPRTRAFLSATTMLSTPSRIAPLAMMARPPDQKMPLEPMLLLADAGVLALYSISSSIAALFASGEWVNELGNPLAASTQDFIEISLAIDSAVALGMGWCLAAAITGTICSKDWFGLDDERYKEAPLGLPGLLSNWLVFWPLAEALKAIAAYGLAASWPATLDANGVADTVSTSAAALELFGSAGNAAAAMGSSSGSGDLVHFLGASPGTAAPTSAALDVIARTAASDGSNSLIALVLFRWWLLAWAQRFR